MRRVIVPACVLALLGFASCDGGIGEGSTEDDSTSTVAPSGPQQIESRIVVVMDTSRTTQTTTSIVKRTFLIKGADTSTLSLDTLTFIGGQNLLDTALQGQQPCPYGLTVFNRYGTEIGLELWAGGSLRYSNGNILGKSPRLVASSPSLLADSAHSKWCPDWKGRSYFDDGENDLLLVVGVPIDPGGPSYLLASGHFPEVASNSILVVDEVGRLRTLR